MRVPPARLAPRRADACPALPFRTTRLGFGETRAKERKTHLPTDTTENSLTENSLTFNRSQGFGNEFVLFSENQVAQTQGIKQRSANPSVPRAQCQQHNDGHFFGEPRFLDLAV